jgi:peptidoglycan-associated lipoprotein
MNFAAEFLTKFKTRQKMKMNRIVLPLVLALVATITATGCKKGQPKLTMLPGQVVPAPEPGGTGGTMGSGGTMSGTENVKTGGGETAALPMFDDMIKDPAALAAYTIHFKFDSAVVMKGDHSKLEAIASALKSSRNDKLLIEGNCDERGTEEYNRALGERRALAAREALAKLGVSPDRIRTISYGKDKPVNPSHDAAAWEANRRDDFVLLHPKTNM